MAHLAERLQPLYSALPSPLQDAICSLEGLRIQWTRYNADFHKAFQKAIERGEWSTERVLEYRDSRLRSFLLTVAAFTPNYAAERKRAGFAWADIKGLEDLRCLPIIDKAQVQTNLKAFANQSKTLGDTVSAHTSGTTGGGLCFQTTTRATQEQWAVWFRYRGWHGIRPGTWCGYFGGRSVVPHQQKVAPFWRLNVPGRQILFSAYHMAPAWLGAYVDELRRRRPPWLHGYPSLLAFLSGYIVDRELDLGYSVRWVTTGAENLLPYQRELIKSAFGVHPREHYGMAEAVANFSECENGRLHVDEDFAAVEFLPAEDPGTFRVVGTNITNPATPLVRYATSDIVTITGAKCTCGRPGRIVSHVDGRQEDYVLLRNGVKVGRMDHIFKDMVHVHEAQIYQEVPGQLIYRIVRGENYSADDEARLLRETESRLGNEASVKVEYLPRLPRTSSGKVRFVISNIAEAQNRSRAGSYESELVTGAG